MNRRGFTLLEVMIALAILAVALVAISDLNGGAVAMHAYSRRASEASLLLRSKMLDLEDQLHKDGFHDFSDEQHGTFDEDGAPDYSWSAEIIKPDIQLDPAQLMSMLGVGGQQKGGTSGAAGMLAGALGGNTGALQGLQTGGAAAMLQGPLGGMLTGQATTFIETLKKSVREVRLTVSWQDGKKPLSVSASQIMVILPESVNQTPQAGVTQQQQQPGVQTATPLPGGQLPTGLPKPPSSDADSSPR